MNFTSWQATVQSLLAITPGDTNGQTLFAVIQADMINDAELRCYRDLQLLDTEEAATTTLSAGSRNGTLPAGMIVVENCNVITPSTALTADAGVRNPVQRMSRQMLDFSFPNAGQTTGGVPSVPAYFCVLDGVNVQFGPAPDAAYLAEFVGTIRPAPLSATNPSTILTQNFPDLFLDASMIFGAGYQRDFGAQSDDPKMAVAWLAEYNAKFQSADMEERRRKAMGPGWSPMVPAPQTTTPPRQ